MVTAFILDVYHTFFLVHEAKSPVLSASKVKARVEFCTSLRLASFVDDVDHAGFLVLGAESSLSGPLKVARGL